MKGWLFKAQLIEMPGYYLVEDPECVARGAHEAAIFDSESYWGAHLVENARECGVVIEWLPEDQQLRHLGAPELPLWVRPEDWDSQFDDPINDIMACCKRHVSECDCKNA